MGLTHSPKVVTDGLVFYYDMGNAEKSWRGRPTTNLANVGLNGMSGITLAFLGLEDGWKKYSMSGTFTGGTYPYTMNITSVAFTGGVTYSSSCLIRTNVENKFNYFGNGMNYVNSPMNKSGTNIGIQQTDGSWYCGRSNFEYTSTTTQLGYILSNPINNTIFNAATDFVWIKNGQVELGEFPSPFAGDAGTRSNTQAVLDLVGNNTITANALTYNVDGSFGFNGSNNGMTVPGTNFSLNAMTIECWCFSTNFQHNGFLFEKTTNGSVNTQYSLFFNNNAGSNLYFRTYGLSSLDLILSKAASGVVDNAWNHVVATFDGSIKRIYVNGILRISSAALTGTIVQNNTGAAFIGIYGNFAGYPFNGKIDSEKIYNRALSATETQQNFNALRGRYGL